MLGKVGEGAVADGGGAPVVSVVRLDGHVHRLGVGVHAHIHLGLLPRALVGRHANARHACVAQLTLGLHGQHVALWFQFLFDDIQHVKHSLLWYL